MIAAAKRPTSDMLIFVFLGLSLFASNFLHSPDFGLYEDDLIYYINAFNNHPSWSEAQGYILSFAQGRPINNLMQWFGALVIWQSQSLFFTYLVCCFLLTVGVYVWYRVFGRLVDLKTALLASLLTFLLPLHTLTEFINGAVSFSVSMVLSGCAILFINRRGAVAQTTGYLCALLTLMSYEFFFPLIYAGGLLSQHWLDGWRIRRSFVIKVLIHAAILTIILAGYTAFREHMGARTASEVMRGSAAQVVYGIAMAAYYGIVRSLSYPSMLFQARYLTAENILLGLSVGTLIYLVFAALTRRAGTFDDGDRTMTSLIEGLITAVVLVILGYVFTFFFTGGNVEPNLYLVGRESRVNIAAVYGHSLLLAIILRLTWGFLRGRWRHVVQAVVLLPVLIALTVERFGVQSDYVSVWNVTKEEVRQIVLLTPDASLGTGIVLEGGMNIYDRIYQPLPAIGYEPHGYNYILGALFEAPTAVGRDHKEVRLERVPLVERVYGPKWPAGLKAVGNGLLRNVLFASDWIWPETDFEPGNIIHLSEDKAFYLRRIDDPIDVNGIDILKPKPVDPLKSGFWDSALPRPTLQHLMPEMALWFSHYQTKRAELRAQIEHEGPTTIR